MKKTFISLAKHYHPIMDVKNTEIAIKYCKDTFELKLAKKLNLIRVSAPLFVEKGKWLNDTLNWIEKAIVFDIKDLKGKKAEIIHSLAKWKRMALYKYKFSEGDWLYTDMNAIRRDEELDEIHSLYVDQRDREKIISKELRTIDLLKQKAIWIYEVLKETEELLHKKFPKIKKILPELIHFISSQELENLYPEKSPKEREYMICKKYWAVFLMQIWDKLKSWIQHDGRAPDYDDWKLNGDILLYYPLLDIALEISSMWIRVDKKSLLEQLEKRWCLDRVKFDYHKMIVGNTLPYTIGWGIGQSRICMFLLKKLHIWEVQSSIWSEETNKLCKKHEIPLL